MIEIYAGDSALRSIQEKGFVPELFTSFLGASGGPKWFTLLGLDKYLFGEFFKERKQVLNLVGSSAGAFRAACFVQSDPVTAVEKLAYHYAESTYSRHRTPKEVTEQATRLLDIVLGESGIAAIIDNPVFKVHFIVALSRGWVASENQVIQGVGLLNSFLNNGLSRRFLRRQYERYIFQTRDSLLDIDDPDNIPTTRVTLTAENVTEALLASGSLPIYMRGVENISGCPAGVYRDGGIIDYHFDLDIRNKGLILYPHFSKNLKAGWFDKKLSRSVRLENYERVVLICPSEAFIASLPYGKIPDRSDFNAMETQQRIRYWKQVLSETERLAEHFERFREQGGVTKIQNIRSLIKPI